MQGTYKGSGQYGSNAFVLKLDPTGANILLATYLGGSGTDGANKVGLDSAGHIFVAGSTSSTDFPLHNPVIGSTSGGFFLGFGFVTEMNSDMTALVYSTYLGGFGGSNGVNGMKVAQDGTVYVVGVTGSRSFQSPALWRRLSMGVDWITVS